MREIEDRDPGIDLDTFDKEAEIAKFKNVIKPVGWHMHVRLYTEPKIVKNVILPDVVRDEGLYKNCVGLVLQLGKGCFEDERYRKTGPWCEVGDWIVFPRHAGFRIFVLGIPIWVLPEDGLTSQVLSDPRDISKYLY
jgi:hypothetical protein